MKREQIIQMARDAGIAIGRGFYEDEIACSSLVLLENFAYAIIAATKEEDAKICEEQMARSRAASEASKRMQEQHVYHHCAVTAEWNAAAIRESK